MTGSRWQILLFCCALLTACGTQYRDPAVPLSAQADVDFRQYGGLWYEIARFPVFFQTGCVGTTASYGQIDATMISVKNTCRQGTLDGRERSIAGRAQIVGPGQLLVQFGSVPFFKAPYWVLWVDEEYQTAVVGTPNGKAGWILSREPQIAEIALTEAQQVLRDNGYQPDDLIFVPQRISTANGVPDQ
ncbi:MAG: lipocalin family protein [Roseobacter sp.]